MPNFIWILYFFIYIPRQIVQIILLFLRHSFIFNIILKIWKYTGFNAWTLRNRFVILLNTFLFNDCTIFEAAEFTVEFYFADSLPTDLICCFEVSWEITDSSLKLEDPITKTAFLSKSEEAYCMQTEHFIRSISLLRTNQLRFFCQLV